MHPGLVTHPSLSLLRPPSRTYRTIASSSIRDMPPVVKPSHEEYDFVVIGGGSGGFGAAVRGRAWVAQLIIQCSIDYMN